MRESEHSSTQAPDEPLVDLALLRTDPAFVRVRHSARRFTFLTGGLLIGWFMVLLWLSAYQRGLLAVSIAGQLTVGIVVAWSQVLTASLAAVLFVRHNKRLDDELSGLRSGMRS